MTKPRTSLSVTQIHANIRSILKNTEREQHQKRKELKLNQEKHEQAVFQLHRITRKIPPKVETLVRKPRRERNYLFIGQKFDDYSILKTMVSHEINKEKEELMDLAERVGFLGQSRKKE